MRQLNLHHALCSLRRCRAAPQIAAALAGLLTGCSGPAAGIDWSPPAAAHYLDGRARAWLGWRQASRDHGTVCLSCHTTLPYTLARGQLRELLAESSLPEPERKLLEIVKQRVGLWSQVLPWYGDQKLASRGTEAVINALVLAADDATRGGLSPLTRTALEHMWALQLGEGPDAGSWPWIQFNNEPWEAPDSAYYGATLAALATGLAPESYHQDPAIQARLALLREYLRREYPHQSLLNRIELLWAAQSLPELIEPAARATLAKEISARQRMDGGWSTASLLSGWKMHDGLPLPEVSDGLATGLVTFVLQTAGIPATDPRIRAGLAWLEGHQSSWNGRWLADSPNRRNGLLPREGDHFMDDAATAFAVLALTRAQAGTAAARRNAVPTAP